MLLGALAAALLIAAPPAPSLSVKERRYLDARAEAMARADRAGGMVVDRQGVMDDLRDRLRELVGPVRMPGVAGQGATAYDGLWGVAAEGTDGLVFDWRGDHLFVTTSALYTNAVTRRSSPGTAKTDDEMVSESILAGMAEWVTFATLPIRHGASTRRARAVVGIGTQDHAPRPPNYLVVQLERGERVFVVGAVLAETLTHIADCEARFNTDRREIPAPAFDDYRRCVGSALPTQPAFAGILRRAQSIVDALEASSGAP